MTTNWLGAGRCGSFRGLLHSTAVTGYPCWLPPTQVLVLCSLSQPCNRSRTYILPAILSVRNWSTRCPPETTKHQMFSRNNQVAGVCRWGADFWCGNSYLGLEVFVDQQRLVSMDPIIWCRCVLHHHHLPRKRLKGKNKVLPIIRKNRITFMLCIDVVLY